MAKLSARGSKILWTVKMTEQHDGATYTSFRALRSDGKLLRRLSIQRVNEYTHKLETDSGHWSIASTLDAAQQHELYLRYIAARWVLA